MNKFWIVVTLILIQIQVGLYGQEENNLKNLIGINVFSYKYVGKDNDYLFFKNKPNFISGMIYTRKHKYFASRYSLIYNHYRTDVAWIGPDSFEGFHLHTISSISIGIQKNHNMKKLDLYYGIDLFNNLIVQKNNLSGGSDGEGNHTEIYDDWIGLSSIFGLQYRIFSRITLKLETSYNIQFVVYSSLFHSDTDKIQSYFNPINSLAICYNF